VGEEEVVCVDDGAPRAADAPGLGERAAWETAEDVEEHVVGEVDAVAVVVGLVHMGGRPAVWCARMNSGKGSDRWIDGEPQKERYRIGGVRSSGGRNRSSFIWRKQEIDPVSRFRAGVV
jgi:hypothetical protein